jgi:hypothetical protein
VADKKNEGQQQMTKDIIGNAKADHEKAAQAIIQLFDSQRINAYEFWKSSAASGLEIRDNPFGLNSHEALNTAWWRGFQDVKQST